MISKNAVFTLVAASAMALPAVAQAQSSEPSTDAEMTWLRLHNEARAEFGSAPLLWNEDLENDAREWAEQLATENRIRHEPRDQREGAGENLWLGTKDVFSNAEMLKEFISEKEYFRAGEFPYNSTTGNWRDIGHYTQVVWPSTTDVGCAMASGTRADILVCRYSPPGNRRGVTLTKK